jgi:hypothetical protein
VALAKEMGARVTGYHGVGTARRAGVPFEPLVARTGATYEGILNAARKRK